jgi:hypothetical protein
MRRQSWRRSIFLTTALGFIGAMGAVGGCGEEDDIEFPPGSGGSVNNPAFAPAEGGVRRMLTHQYLNTVRYLLGDGPAEAVVAADLLPADVQVQGYLAIGAAETPPGLNNPELWDLTADTVAKAVVADPSGLAQWVPCIQSGPQDDACYDSFADSFGRMAFRRPISPEEKTWITGLAKQARTWGEGDFMTGIQYSLRAILQSPNFLYLVEVGDTEANAVTPRRKLNQYELATRMSFFLTDTTPDQELLDAADAKSLATAEALRAQADRLIKKPSAQLAVRLRFNEILYIDLAMSAQKSPDFYPQFDDNVRVAMVEEAYRFLDDIFWTRNADAREMFTADYTFVNAPLAPIYGFAAPLGTEWKKAVWKPEEERAGFLSMGAFLVRASHAVTTSPTRRGVFIKDRVLCENVPPPDPDVNPVLPQPEPGDPPKTTKELVEAHMKEDRCRACHAQFDPYGFSLEHFDAIGAFRAEDAGYPVDSTGQIDGFGDFASPRDIADLLISDESQRVSRCIMLNVFRSSIGHIETEGEAVALDELHAAFEKAGFSMQGLMVETTLNPAFLYIAELAP